MEKKILDLLNKVESLDFKEIRKRLNIYGLHESRKLDSILRKLNDEDKIFYRWKTKKYQIKDKRTVIGTFLETLNDYSFVENENGDSYFIPGKFCLNALHGDTVKILVFEKREDSKGEAGKVIRVIKRNGNNLVGEAKKRNDGKLIIDIADPSSKKDHVVINPIGISEGDILVTKYMNYVDNQIEVKVIDNLGKQTSENDWLVVAKRNNIEPYFNDELLNEANNIKINNKKRKELFDRMIVTIDGEESKDLDDAIDISILSNGNWRLGVHIADVSNYVKENTLVDSEARRRGTSIYLINHVIPMLPEILSNNLCSLTPNTEKLTMTADMEINKSGDVVNIDVYESKIISKYRLTYNEVKEFFDNEKKLLREDNELSNMLIEAKKLSLVSRKRKIDNGMIDFDLPEIKIKLDENGNPIDIFAKYQGSAEKLIEDLMVLTNESIAKILTRKKIHTLFRVHTRPQLENIEKFKENIRFFGHMIDKNSENITNKDLMNLVNSLDHNDHSSLIVKRMLIQTMEKAIYSPNDMGHYGLGLKNYLHFTSPIRRYPDLIVHRTIKKMLLNNNGKQNIDELEKLATSTSKSERLGMTIERKLMDIKKSRIMANKIGTIENGTIVSITNFGIFIELENFVQGLVRFENIKFDKIEKENQQSVKLITGNTIKKYSIGQNLLVKITDLDYSKGLINLNINEDSGKK